MKQLTITAKRQATLPKELCMELNLQPGDTVTLERYVIQGKPVWAMSTQPNDWSWLGGAKSYAQGKSHKLSDIRASIAAGRHPA